MVEKVEVEAKETGSVNVVVHLMHKIQLIIH